MTRPQITIELVAKLEGHKDAVYDFTFQEETNTLYSVGADGYVVAWQLAENAQEGSLVLTASEALYSVDLCNEKLSVGSRSGVIYSVDLDKKKLLEQRLVHKGGVFFINDHLSGGEDGKLFYKNGGSKPLATSSLRCLLEEESYLYVGCSDHHIYQLEKDTYEVERIFKGHTNSVFALAFLDKNTLVSTGRDAMIRVWDITIGKEVHAVPAHDYQAKSLSWNGQILLSSSMDKTIKLWNEQLDLWKVIDYERYQGHTNCINKVRWIDENMFVSCSDDRSLCLWKVEIMP